MKKGETKLKGNIDIYKNPHIVGESYVINSTPDVFKSKRVAIKVDDEKVVIESVGIDYIGATQTPVTHTNTGTRVSIHITNDKLKKGMYEIDKEESTEDKIIAYFEDKIN